MFRRPWTLALCGLLACLASRERAARAEAPLTHPPVHLVELPADKLSAMGPILRQGDVALIESWPGGRMKQVTILSLVAAPPDVVRDVVSRPEKYGEMINNLEDLKVARGADGWCRYSYGINLTITEIRTFERMHARPGGWLEVRATNPTDHSAFEWEFIGVPGGTVLVQYGYTDILHSGPFVQRLVRATPTIEHGLAVSVQLALVRAVKKEAERRAKPDSFPPFDPHAKGPGLGFLLKRGRVAVVRSRPDGHLSDISLIDTVYAPREKVMSVLMHPNAFSKFVDGMSESYEVSRQGPQVTYVSKFGLSLFSWQSRYVERESPAAVDVYAVSGDLRGARFRWDLIAHGPSETQVVYRANQDLAATSPLILGAVFRKLPMAEHGLAVTLGLMRMVGVRGRAEGWR